ncbi:uncharacterized protein AMSG_00048 [Thecamonas trahens ATCC 50062]|uniref:RING-type domain-containing protein n=1 Tax=Thecamonas trahens ATCC 50062 TaxID=461836 RepID=A0A0L0D0N3_THETB|nr:hypothetical protein AMSG_00048 [Thecamonas trahens ATCC 50062]KNC45934.1 hypothetical protein AMSG_00048 [Thecamonas trahens ATCC 50062]|eukprot:XP_013762917.1 hypothetical protein AMSG_00048 [Thecamonas trahens ATCC 50062]
MSRRGRRRTGKEDDERDNGGGGGGGAAAAVFALGALVGAAGLYVFNSWFGKEEDKGKGKGKKGGDGGQGPSSGVCLEGAGAGGVFPQVSHGHGAKGAPPLARAPPASDEGADRGMCTVCWEADAVVLIEPCHHLCLCEDDAAVIVASGAPCPMCRGPIANTVRVFPT